VIAEPPVSAGAVQTTFAEAFREVANTPVATLGTVAGTTAPDAIEEVPDPTTFVAVTVNVYETPLVRPVTVHEVEDVLQVNAPGLEVTVYEVTSLEPFDAGAAHETEADVFPNTPTTFKGGPGTLAMARGVDGVEDGLEPAIFLATTVNE